MSYKISPLSFSIHSDTESRVFGENTIIVSVDDEAAGEFIVLQSNEEGCSKGQVRIDFNQIELINEAINLLKESK